MTQVRSYDVDIIGLGPVGSLAAILLGDAGLNVVAFEKDKEVYQLPRAVNLDGEIIRAFQPSGLADDVDAMMQTLRTGDRAGFTNSKREWLFGGDSVSFGNNGWQPQNMFDQPEFEQFLRDTVKSHPKVKCHIGVEVTEFVERLDGVTLTTINDSKFEVTQACYLVACDGASSPTRKALNIGWKDLGYDRDWLVVDVITNDKHTLTNEVLQVCDPERIHTYVATKDPYRRWEFRLNPGETAQQMLEPEMINTLIEKWTPRDSYTVRRAAVYQFHAATATQWQTERVFLAGDAAHQSPPFLGQGMNTGMRDVINLSWKLALVLNGKCQPDLLNSYQQERDAHAHDLVSWAVAIGHLMEFLASKEAAEINNEPVPQQPQEIASSGYGQGREQPPIRAGAVIDEQVSNDSITGYLLNQPLIKTLQDNERRLDDVLGTGFSIVGYGTELLELNDASRLVIEKLNINIVDLEKLTVSAGKFSFEAQQAIYVIVRPDKLIFGQTTETLDINQLISMLAKKLSLI